MAEKFDKQAAIRKMYGKHREINAIKQDFANKAAINGEMHFNIEIATGQLKRGVLELGKIKDELDAAIKAQPPQPDQPVDPSELPVGIQPPDSHAAHDAIEAASHHDIEGAPV